ncbi:MAG: SNF2-related protein [Coriobacteriales bacterium]
MIEESVIEWECPTATVFNRARSVAKHNNVYDRQCIYRGDSTTKLKACIESSGWSGDTYDVTVDIDEDKGYILSYSCTCPAHLKYPGMCKHAAALVLMFNREPRKFVGYSPTRATSTARSLAELMELMGKRKASTAKAASSLAAGSIQLEPRLRQEDSGRWSVSFKVASPRASYVVKNIGDFLGWVDSGAYHAYGMKLAFAHSREMFSERAWELVQWVQRCTSANSRWWQEHEWGYSSGRRDLFLSNAQAVDLLDMFVGEAIECSFYAGPDLNRTTKTLQVVERDPELALELLPLKNGGYELLRASSLGFIVFGQRVYAWDQERFYRCSPAFSPSAEFLLYVYENGEEHITISDDDIPLFCSTVLPALQQAAAVRAPKEVEALKPVPGRLEFYLDVAKRGGAACQAKALYGKAEYNLVLPGSEAGKPPRDDALEAPAREALRRYLPVVAGGIAFTGDDEGFAELLFRGVDELKGHGEVFATDAFDRRRVLRRPSVQAGLSIRGNLVNLDVSADDMTPAEVAALLASYQGRKRYHKLKDGRFVDLEQGTEDLERLELMAEELGITARELASGSVELDAYNAFLLDALADDDEKDASFKAFVEAFSDARGNHHELPAPLQGVLRPYQVEGFNWLSTLADTGLAGILADEMGLGKSLQVISLLMAREAELEGKPALIVCPASLVYNWQAEFKKFAPHMEVAVLAGPKAQRAGIREQGGYQVLVTSYDTLRIDIEAMRDAAFSYQVIDEAQYIKNHATKAARAVKAVSAEHRIALTGTPIENRLSELWSIFDYLMPGMLGPYKRFRERYEAPILAGEAEVSARLGAKVGPFILRRLKKDVLSDLPEKLETVVHAQLEGDQQSLYKAHAVQLLQSIDSQNDDELAQEKMAILAALTRLRQICCDPRLIYSDYKHAGAKMGTICELIASAIDSGQKVLVFSQFTSFLDLIAAELAARGWEHYTITGATPKKERVKLVERFNADEVPVFLISLKAGGTGLNLVGASVVIHADPWWNAAAQNQATDRAHRIGQTRDVSVFKVIADGTIEERILELQEAKSNLADAVLSADSTSLASLSREELISLLSEG